MVHFGIGSNKLALVNKLLDLIQMGIAWSGPTPLSKETRAMIAGSHSLKRLRLRLFR